MTRSIPPRLHKSGCYQIGTSLSSFGRNVIVPIAWLSYSFSGNDLDLRVVTAILGKREGQTDGEVFIKLFIVGGEEQPDNDDAMPHILTLLHLFNTGIRLQYAAHSGFIVHP